MKPPFITKGTDYDTWKQVYQRLINMGFMWNQY